MIKGKLVKIDPDKCVKCQRCVKVCPFTALKAENGVPQRDEEKFCIECMHCAATCPQNAISFEEKSAAENTAVKKMSPAFTAELESHIISRRSYRHFEDRPVEKDVMQKTIDMSRWAASAKNQHPTHWVVVNGKEKVDKIMDCVLRYTAETGVSPEIATEYAKGNNVVVGNARTLLFGCCKPGFINPPVDTAIAMTSIELVLQAQGIGTCWCGYLTRLTNAIDEIKYDILHLDEDDTVYASMMMGYPEHEKYVRIPARPFDSEISWIE